MSKNERSVLIVAVTVLIIFALNYFVALPTIVQYNENLDEVVQLDEEIAKLEQNIAQGAELEAAIAQTDANIVAVGLEEYYNENYSVHNFFVDTAQKYGITVSSLSLSEVTAISNDETDTSIAAISEHPLIAGQMEPEEITAIPAYYEIVLQNTSMSLEGNINTILDYADELAKDDIYMVLPAMSLTDFINNNEEQTISLQFVQYSYRVAENNTELTQTSENY